MVTETCAFPVISSLQQRIIFNSTLSRFGIFPNSSRMRCCGESPALVFAIAAFTGKGVRSSVERMHTESTVDTLRCELTVASVCRDPFLYFPLMKAMVGTGEALLSIRAKGGSAAQADGKGVTSVSTSQEFDFQGELQKFDKVNRPGMVELGGTCDGRSLVSPACCTWSSTSVEPKLHPGITVPCRRALGKGGGGIDNT